MNYWIHPEAAAEHQQQIAYYEEAQPGLGRRYHLAYQNALERACTAPLQARIIQPPDLRKITFKVFQFGLIYREVEGVVQVLAIAHHRRQPGFWRGRL